MTTWRPNFTHEKKSKPPKFSFALSYELRDEWKEFAKMKGLSIGSLIRLSVREYIINNSEKKKDNSKELEIKELKNQIIAFQEILQKSLLKLEKK